MKAINIFGKSVPIAVVLMVVLALTATAVLVSYLSNTIRANAEVRSPIELRIGTVWNDLATGSIVIGPIYGGESIELFVSTQNLASVSITGTMWNIVANEDGITCGDFSSLTARVLNMDGTEKYPSETIGCEVIDANSVRLITTPTEPWTWAVGLHDIADITAVFEEGAHGTYIVSTYVHQ